MNITERIELEKRWHEKTGMSLGRRLADIHELGRQSAQDEAEAWRASLSIVAEALGVSLDEVPADVGLGNWLAGLVRRPTSADPGTAIDTHKLRRIGKMMSNGEYISCTSGIVRQAAEHIDAQATEIERLKKALRVAVLALAHATQEHGKVYEPAYNAVDSALAQHQGEKHGDQ